MRDERINSCKTTEYFKHIYKYLYLIGWPNFWYNQHDVPDIIIKYHDIASTFLNACGYFLVFLELAAFFTQNDLSEKQENDRMLFSFSHPFLASYGFIMTYFQEKIRQFTYSLTVELKNEYNDEYIDMDMVRKARLHSMTYCFICGSALVLYGLDGVQQCLFVKDATFVTVVSAWPDLNDHSTPAAGFRILVYLLWWIFMLRVSGLYVMLISTFVCLGHQYKNLQSYFYSLEGIFVDDELTQKEKEEKYEQRLKLGINMHARTLRCTLECETAFNGVISGQILVNVAVIILLMGQMLNSERSLSSVGATLSTMSAMLISTGCFMWNAGDVAVEAKTLSTAMFASGWHNCRGASSVRVRRLLVIAMTQAQVPVTIRALGVIAMSYDSYVSIVKSSYSVFSVLY